MAPTTMASSSDSAKSLLSSNEEQQLKEEYNNYNVPQKYKENPQLGGWVRKQRQSKNTMSEEPRKRLNSIGFTWEVQGAHRPKSENPTEGAFKTRAWRAKKEQKKKEDNIRVYRTCHSKFLSYVSHKVNLYFSSTSRTCSLKISVDQ